MGHPHGGQILPRAKGGPILEVGQLRFRTRAPIFPASTGDLEAIDEQILLYFAAHAHKWCGPPLGHEGELLHLRARRAFRGRRRTGCQKEQAGSEPSWNSM